MVYGRHAMRAALTLLALIASAAPLAAESVRLGVAAPLSGPSAVLGLQIASGAGEAAGERAEVIAFDTECTAEGGADAARTFVENEVSAVVGFLCRQEIEAALPILTDAGIPVLAVGVRANRLTDERERTGHLVWRLGPRTDGEADALADFVRTNWRDQPFGIVDDGSVNARDLSDEIRARLGPESVEPSLVDDFRPAEEVQFALARRILQSGVTRLLVFGTRSDVAVLARDAAELGLELDIVGSEQLLDESGEGPDLPSGVRAVAVDPNAGTRSEDTPREGYFGPAFAATQVALDALDGVGSGTDFPQAIEGTTFGTVLGPLDFDERGESTLPAFEVLTYDGARFVPGPQS